MAIVKTVINVDLNAYVKQPMYLTLIVAVSRFGAKSKAVVPLDRVKESVMTMMSLYPYRIIGLKWHTGEVDAFLPSQASAMPDELENIKRAMTQMEIGNQIIYPGDKDENIS